MDDQRAEGTSKRGVVVMDFWRESIAVRKAELAAEIDDWFARYDAGKLSREAVIELVLMRVGFPTMRSVIGLVWRQVEKTISARPVADPPFYILAGNARQYYCYVKAKGFAPNTAVFLRRVEQLMGVHKPRVIEIGSVMDLALRVELRATIERNGGSWESDSL